TDTVFGSSRSQILRNPKLSKSERSQVSDHCPDPTNVLGLDTRYLLRDRSCIRIGRVGHTIKPRVDPTGTHYWLSGNQLVFHVCTPSLLFSFRRRILKPMHRHFYPSIHIAKHTRMQFFLREST